MNSSKRVNRPTSPIKHGLGNKTRVPDQDIGRVSPYCLLLPSRRKVVTTDGSRVRVGGKQITKDVCWGFPRSRYLIPSTYGTVVHPVSPPSSSPSPFRTNVSCTRSITENRLVTEEDTQCRGQGFHSSPLGTLKDFRRVLKVHDDFVINGKNDSKRILTCPFKRSPMYYAPLGDLIMSSFVLGRRETILSVIFWHFYMLRCVE